MAATALPTKFYQDPPTNPVEMLQAHKDLAAYLTWLFGTDGERATALSTLGAQALSPNYTGVKASNITAATTTNIGAATGDYIHITGTTTITAFDTIAAGIERTIVFDSALTLTHNATSLILPTGANITTVTGDTAIFRSEGGGNWRLVGGTVYSKNSEATWVANDSRVKTALNASGSAPIYACRAWVNFNGSGTVAIRASGNVSSITDNGVGNYTVNFTTAMPDTNYSIAGIASITGYVGVSSPLVLIEGLAASDTYALKTTSAITVFTIDNNYDAAFDAFSANVSIFR